jgi:hypothetical protein
LLTLSNAATDASLTRLPGARERSTMLARIRWKTCSVRFSGRETIGLNEVLIAGILTDRAFMDSAP